MNYSTGPGPNAKQRGLLAEKAEALRIKDVRYQVILTDSALLRGAIAHLECRIVARHDGGDHTIFVASVDHAATFEGRPLLYYRGGYAELER